MAVPVGMPELGMYMQEGTVARWLKGQGERVGKGEPLVEVASDKVTFAVEALSEGVVHISEPEGAVVPVAGIIGYILAPGETPPGAPGQAAPQAPSALSQVPSTQIELAPEAPSFVKASPLARKLAQEKGVDLAQVKGSGPGGRITEADIEAYLAQKEAAPTPVMAPPPPAPVAPAPSTARTIPLTGARGIIAERMYQSLREAAQITYTAQVDAGELVALREKLLAQGDKLGARISYNDILVLICARALKDYPIFNSTIRDNAIHIIEEINIGVAVAVDDSLLVPVVRNADKKSILEISREISSLVERARNHTLKVDDIRGGSFTLSNLGAFGVDVFTAILNPPESAALGVGRIREAPVAVKGQVVVRPITELSLTTDHRVADGAPSGLLLKRITELIENPSLLLT